MGLQSVELIMCVEDTFAVVLPEAIAGNLVTVGDLHEAVMELLRAKGATMDPDEVLEQLRAIIVEQLGVRACEVIPAAGIVDDLGAN